MIQRCTNPNYEHFVDYGKRGIIVCEKWYKFEAFLSDMGLKPSQKYSIERINNDGNYEPDNCKWATQVEQGRNQRINKNNTSGVRGVHWNKKASKWAVRIKTSERYLHIGYFNNIQEAAEARKLAEEKYWKTS